MIIKQIKPYTYVIVHKITGFYYFGVRYANVVEAEDDLGKRYFSSSSTVKKIIEAEGVEAFDWFVRRKFENNEEACLIEYRTIKKIFKNKKCLNKRPSHKYTPGNWFTNGKDNILGKYCPMGFKPGRTIKITENRLACYKNQKQNRWFNNGYRSIFCPFPPSGLWEPGRIKSEVCRGPRPKMKDKKWWNNGIENFRGITPPNETFKMGRLKFVRGKRKNPPSKEQNESHSKLMKLKKWYNDGKISKMLEKQIDGFLPGRLPFAKKNIITRPFSI